MNRANFNHNLDPLDEYIDNHIGTKTTRHASEDRFECPSLIDAVRAERLMRSTINEFFDHNSIEPVGVGIPTLAKTKQEYWEGAQYVSEKHGARPNFKLDDYFKVDQDRYYSLLRSNVMNNYDPESVTAYMFDGIEAYIHALSIDSVLASRFMLNLFKRRLPLIQQRAYALTNSGLPEVLAARIAVKEFSTLFVPEHIGLLATKAASGEHQLHTIVNKTSAYPEVDISGVSIDYLPLSADDAKGFGLVSRIQERPYTQEELAYANELFKDRALQKSALLFHMAYVDYAATYLAQHPERLQHSLEPFTEIFVGIGDRYVPNPKLLRVIGNNALPAIARVMLAEDVDMFDITPSFIQEGVVLAKKLQVFQTQIGEFAKRQPVNQEIESVGATVELKSVFTRTCPAMNMFTDALATNLPAIYEKCS
jgi:hypothetical protein